MTVWLGKVGVTTRAAMEHDGMPVYVPYWWTFFGLGPLLFIFTGRQGRWVWRIDR